MKLSTKNCVETRTLGWQLSYWGGQLRDLMFRQEFLCRSLREVTFITKVDRKKSVHLGFDKEAIVRNILSKFNANREWYVLVKGSNNKFNR